MTPGVTCVGCLSAAVAYVRRPLRPRDRAVLPVLADAWAEAAVERQRRATIIAVITHLPPGVCVAERDAVGRERFIGPAATVPMRRYPGPGW